jgi:hypothetical protein
VSLGNLQGSAFSRVLFFLCGRFTAETAEKAIVYVSEGYRLIFVACAINSCNL